jgi:hypothetical protein
MTNVCCWHITDVPLVPTNVCFEGKNGQRERDTISAYDPKRTWLTRCPSDASC